MGLNANSPIPLHIQLKEILEQQILNGYYKDRLPSERELVEKYAVSRSTVREAVSILVREGIVEKKHGKGTFVSLKPIQDWLAMTSFAETIKNMGIRLLNHGIVETPKNIADVNGFVGQSYHIKRLRLKENTPVAIEKHYYPLELGNKLLQFDLNTVILYDALEVEMGINFWEAEQIITSAHPSAEDAGYLEVPQTSCLLVTERMIWDAEGNLIEYYEGYFRSDMYSFVMKMSRKTG